MCSEPPKDPVTTIPGVGPARARLLHNLGLHTVGGLLHNPPRRYLDGSRRVRVRELVAEQRATVRGIVHRAGWHRTRTPGLWRGRALLKDEADDELQLVWFARTKSGRRPPHMPVAADLSRYVTVHGVAGRDGAGKWQMVGPEVEVDDGPSLHTGRIVPEYALTAGLSQRQMRRIVYAAIEKFADDADETLPAALRADVGLPAKGTALRQLHFPDDEAASVSAQRRFAFEELLTLRLAVARRAEGRRHGKPGYALPADDSLYRRWVENLPFSLTTAQKAAVDEIAADVSEAVPMQRLLQGDVGSGKTVVAAYTLLRAFQSGLQGALLAPSEILAAQHARTLATSFLPFGVPVHLLTGTTPAPARRDILAAVSAGEPAIVVGTHALLSADVRFQHLAVLVVDEQHRFGVAQRAALAEGPRPPHLLVVSATPIPRTLALCVYGDLDVSVLRDGPPGRRAVDTRWVRPARATEVYAFVRREVKRGGRAFLVYPTIGDEGDGGDDDAASEAQLLTAARHLVRTEFKHIRCDVVHGRQTSAEQAAAMERFRRGESQVLLATTVVEVGIDVPEATVMVIHGAERFGLAQLHQLRGRVGRGAARSYCILVADPPTEAARRRLDVLRTTDDGFELARADLRLRGAGDLLGLRQAGRPDLSPLVAAADGDLLDAVHRWADVLLGGRNARKRGARDDDAAVAAGVSPAEAKKLWAAVAARFDAVAAPNTKAEVQ